MNWKHFLKPDWRKIVAFLIIFGFLFFSPLIPLPIYANQSGSGGGPVFFSWDSFYDKRFVVNESLMAGIGYILFAIIMLIISYILSCLIIWIYDNFRKKNKK